MERVIDLREKRKIKNIETEEKVGSSEVIFTITFDDDEKMIIDLSLLGEITGKVAEELEELERKCAKRMGLELLAALIAMGESKKDVKDFLNDLR